MKDCHNLVVVNRVRRVNWLPSLASSKTLCKTLISYSPNFPASITLNSHTCSSLPIWCSCLVFIFHLKMLHCLSLLLLLLLLPLSSPFPATGPHIADVNILLPPKMTHPVEYRLQGSDGCFKWYVSNSDSVWEVRVSLLAPRLIYPVKCNNLSIYEKELLSLSAYAWSQVVSVQTTWTVLGYNFMCKLLLMLVY